MQPGVVLRSRVGSAGTPSDPSGRHLAKNGIAKPKALTTPFERHVPRDVRERGEARREREALGRENELQSARTRQTKRPGCGAGPQSVVPRTAEASPSRGRVPTRKISVE
eukprot:7383562-Prymnesium_polylepis.1